MPLSRLFQALAFFPVFLWAAASHGAETQKPVAPPPPMGQFEASGARIGMDIGLAIKAISATKPQWSAGLAASGAQQDCGREGRAIANLEFTGGLVSARMDARCSTDGRGGGSLQDIAIATLIGPSLSSADVRAALIARYGAPDSESQLPGKGFEMTWSAPASADPSAIQGETLSATLTARPADSTPIALALRLVATGKAAEPAGAARERALSRLPF
jgi:hypothetical protein